MQPPQISTMIEFIGDIDIISSPCSGLAVKRDVWLYVYVLSRGQTLRPVPEGAHVTDRELLSSAVGFDKNNAFNVAEVGGPTSTTA